MMILLKRVLLLSIIFFVVPAYADRLYKWVDEFGNVTYQRQPPPEDEASQVEEKNIRTSSDETAGGLEATVRNYKFPVTLYSSNKCASCGLARDYFNKNRIPFKEKNVEGNHDYAEELTRVSGEFSVPVITIADKVIRGYSRVSLEDELARVGYIKKAEDTQGSQESGDEAAQSGTE
ncbi:MAG: glutaredoxin family protein [Gammaproteobacteria bacterium]|nr:glutaredoxin family protein [Gammaproteobacteria bacterium]